MSKIIDKINCCLDVKSLNLSEMQALAFDIREGILNRVNQIGGHLGPDLGIVEATIALHYVFDCPKDRFVFDVSHQCYPHKMLTGRKQGFLNPTEYPEVSGYFDPMESECDSFKIGHTSTSISLATGLAKSRDLKGETHNVIALIGDGSLSGGEAYEGLNNGAELKTNFIVIVNDNEMSIAENAGGLYGNLEELRKTKGCAANNFFKALGYDYLYLEEGNDIEKLIETFKKVKDINHPVVVHIHTLKGKGYKPAEENKEIYHWQLPNFLNKNKECPSCKNYADLTADYLLEKIKEDKTIVAISPATPGAYSFYKPFRDKMGKNYTDVGIAEEHAVAYASALAKDGSKPVLAILSSFIQRTYDQLSQDLALNNSPATILVHWGSITGADATHLGVFDIPLVSNIPNIVYLAPTNKEEYFKMLDFSLSQTKFPVAIRVPFVPVVSTDEIDNTDYSIINKSKVIKKGEKVAVMALGNFFGLGQKVVELLKAELNIDSTLINPVYISGVDKNLLDELKEDHKVVITLEDGVVEGGWGQKVSSYLGGSNLKVINFGATKEFTDRIPVEDLYQKYHLTPELIVDDIKKVL